jgi:outer membrane receptor protein involved in Fe transport
VGSHIAALVPPYLYFGYRVDLPISEIDPYEYIDVFDLPQFRTVAPSGAPVTTGSRNQFATYFEAQVPIVSGFDLQLAARADAVEGFDSRLSPRLAFRWQVLNRHSFRGSWGQGFRAPSLAELNEGASTRVQASWDPELCPEPGFLLPQFGGCVTKAFLTVSGGNDDLLPERSESWSFGWMANWLDQSLTSSADCWRVRVEDRIVALGPERILRHERSLGPGFVERRPPEPSQIEAGINGYADRLNNQYTNAAEQKVTGCDPDIQSVVVLDRFGTFSTQFVGTHMTSNKFRAVDSEPYEELAGTYGVPENRANLNFYWQRNRVRGGVQGRYIGSYDDAIGEGTVGAHTEWDFQLGWRAIDWLDVVFGVVNVFDEQPPQSSSLQGFATQYYDMRGRFYYLQARLGSAASPMRR